VRWLYESPERHPRLGRKNGIDPGRARSRESDNAASICGYTAALAADLGDHTRRSLTDPVWFFVADWFADYLVSKVSR